MASTHDDWRVDLRRRLTAMKKRKERKMDAEQEALPESEVVYDPAEQGVKSLTVNATAEPVPPVGDLEDVVVVDTPEEFDALRTRAVNAKDNPATAGQDDTGIFEVVSLGWGVMRDGQVLSTGSKGEMIKDARVLARGHASDAVVTVYSATGMIVRKEYF